MQGRWNVEHWANDLQLKALFTLRGTKQAHAFNLRAKINIFFQFGFFLQLQNAENKQPKLLEKQIYFRDII